MDELLMLTVSPTRIFHGRQRFWGDPEFLDAIAGFLNQHFNPNVVVSPDHIVIAPGAAACLDVLLYNICDAQECVIIPDPY